MLHKIKGSLLASLLLFFSLFVDASIPVSSELETLALQKKLYDNPTWSALLHVVDSKTLIDDKNFILSIDDFSLKNELISTVRYLYKNNESSCRFPARRNFILSALGLPTDYIAEPNCADYISFKKKAPAKTISLIYASENLTQPSSMMGHVMLKMSGENSDGLSVDHGVSYFTQLNSFNVPMIIWDSLVTGKKGYFQVSPFQEKLDFYLNEEQRNVWEYKINVTDEQAVRFQDHLWELKSTELKYFFNSYNCATVTLLLLRVASAEKIMIQDSWLSPLDVVKAIHYSGVVANTQVNPSSKWRVRMLASALDNKKVRNVAQFVDNKGNALELNGYSATESYLSTELASAYNNYNAEMRRYDKDKWQGINGKIKLIRDQQSGSYELDLSNFKSPVKTPKDAQISLGYRHYLGDNWANIKYMPASHGIEDDNRQFFSENELKLMSMSILAKEDTGELKLESLTLYSARSDIPWDPLTGGVSGQFKLGLEQHWNDQLDPNLSAYVYGGVGYSYAVSRDVSLFSMISTGLGGASDGAYIYAEPEVGLYLYEVFNMKTIVTYKKIYNQQKAKYAQSMLSFKQTILGLNDWSVYGEYEKRWNTFYNVEQFGVHVKYQF